MKPLNTSQYGPEHMGEGPAKKSVERIEVGRGVKPPSLHGIHTLETKRKFGDNEANKIDIDDELGLQVRKAVSLDYIEGGGDGKGDEISERIEMFKRENPSFIDHEEVDELYPTRSSTKSDADYDGDKRLKE